MSNIKIEVYPRIYKANTTGRINLRLSDPTLIPTVRISGMERYTIPHDRRHRIDDEERYPFLPLTPTGDGGFYIDYDFCSEQCYCLTLLLPSGEITPRIYLYSLSEELFGLRGFKGDTHLHTCRSDGRGTPFEVAVDYRASGFDFIAITDHHKYHPSVEGRDAISALTDLFAVYPGEEVHNRDMGYFHIINFGGERSINDEIEADPEEIERQVDRLLATVEFSGCADPYECAYRMLISNKIREAGGVSVLTHPFWECYGEYNMQLLDMMYLLRRGAFDCLEVVAGCDGDGHGNNIQMSVWADLRAEGGRIPVVGSSDAHTTRPELSWDKFDLQYTLAFAPSLGEIKEAIRADNSVAVARYTEDKFLVVGRLPLVKYARFLLREFFPEYSHLTARHAELISAVARGEAEISLLRAVEAEITEFTGKFYGI